MPTNAAAWSTGTQRLLEVKEAPYTRPLSNKLVIKNGAVAVNPVDWIKIEMGEIMFSWIKYPFIFGYDNVGEVVEAGSSVTRFKVGESCCWQRMWYEREDK
jgi:NADPH:quinone reductase-like Zn-dependent oxidoreductase